MTISKHFAGATRYALATALSVSFGSIAVAQGAPEAQDVLLRNDCRLAVQTLSQGHPAPKTDWALTIIYLCDESGGPALQTLWASPPTDSTALEQLVQASARLLDQRVYVGVRAVATNTGAPASVRIAALRVLASFVDSRKLDFPTRLLHPSADSTLGVSIDHGTPQTIGFQPLAGDVVSSITALFATLPKSDPDPLVRYAARRLTPNPGG